MIEVILIMVLGIVNLIFPGLSWYLSRLMFRFKNGDIYLKSEKPNSFVLILNRVIGIILISISVTLLINLN